MSQEPKKESVEDAAKADFLKQATDALQEEYIKLNGGVENIIDPPRLHWYIEGAKFGARWQQSDPDFIAKIVGETLEYLEMLNPRYIKKIIPQIVNQIIKKK